MMMMMVVVVVLMMTTTNVWVHCILTRAKNIVSLYVTPCDLVNIY